MIYSVDVYVLAIIPGGSYTLLYLGHKPLHTIEVRRAALARSSMRLRIVNFNVLRKQPNHPPPSYSFHILAYRHVTDSGVSYMYSMYFTIVHTYVLHFSLFIAHFKQAVF